MTKKERAKLIKLLVTVTDCRDGEMHPNQEQSTYSDGVADCIDILDGVQTVQEILNS